jgi:hypothetical protein
MQRAERLVLTCLACLFDRPAAAAFGWPEDRLLLGVLVVITIGAFGTAVHRTVFIARRLKEREAAGSGPPPA